MTQNTMEEKWKMEFAGNFMNNGLNGVLDDKFQDPQMLLIRDFIASEKQISYQEGFKKAMGEVREEIKEIMHRPEQVNGFQPFGYAEEGEEQVIYFTGFKDGRDLMKIDLLSLISQLSEEESKENK